jgi:hypothetical protein
MSDTRLANYLRDLGTLLREDALAVKKARDATSDPLSRQFQSGRLMAYNEVISTIQNQASAFGLEKADVGLQGIDPDRDLT